MKWLIEWLTPEVASSIGDRVNAITNYIMIVSVFFFLVIFIGMVIFIFKYHRSKHPVATSQVDHNLKLEIVWTAIPLFLVMIMFVWGFRVYLDMVVPPKDAMEIRVTGQKWFWTFDYSNGASSPGELVVPLNTPVKVIISSKDVLHSMFIPSFRVMMAALPNRYTIAWFEGTKLGEYPLYCTQYCGTQHSGMRAKVRVVTMGEFQSWLDQANSGGKGIAPEDYGKTLYKKYACSTCHSIDGTRITGPSWKGIWNKREATSAGTITVDENYIRESILNPTAKIVDGYQPVMPSYQGILKDKDIDAIIAYIKTIK